LWAAKSDDTVAFLSDIWLGVTVGFLSQGVILFAKLKIQL